MDGQQFVDIHCHLLAGIDDGSTSLDETLAMARLAVDDGIRTIVTTPHQLGNYGANRGDDIRRRVVELQSTLAERDIPLDVLPGGDVRIEPGMIDGLKSGDVLTLADRGRHVLLELPHELYFPLEPILRDLRNIGVQGILSHPERNQGLRAQPKLIPPLVEAGCLMQVTAGSLVGTFGPAAQALAESMLRAGHVHFLATDAHRATNRRPLIRRAFDRAVEWVGVDAAVCMTKEFPGLVIRGEPVPAGRLRLRSSAKRGWFRAAV